MEINGKKVVDAKRTAKILITPRDAKEGANKNPSDCAAARAAKRDIPECLNARVHIGRVYVEQKDKWVRYFTPESLRTEIIAFDRGGTFQTGEYELKPPSPCETIQARRETRSSATPSRPSRTKSPRKVRVAKIKRHNVSGIRPKGGNR